MSQAHSPSGVPQLSLLYRSEVTIGPPLSVGMRECGERRIINITGGSFQGPRLNGIILPGGADWQVIRPDGIAEIEARYTLQTHDGAVIYVDNPGLRHGPPEVMRRLAAGEPVDPALYYFRTTPRFETGAEKYLWLNGIIAVASGERYADRVIITVYELS